METRTTCRDLALLRELLNKLDSAIRRIKNLGPPVEYIQEASYDLHRWLDVQEEEYTDGQEWCASVNAPVLAGYAVHLALRDRARTVDQYAKLTRALREEPPFDWETEQSEAGLLEPGTYDPRD